MAYGAGAGAMPVDAKASVEALLRRQIEYYFSADNLTRDFFLRGKMDPQGWVPAAEIARFNRVRAILAAGADNPDPGMAVVAALKGSVVVEAVGGPVPQLRARVDGARWALAEGGQ